jgi:tRNA (guanine-N7-)-methyltransferase
VTKVVPENYVAALDLEKIFGRRGPLQVDLGCGEGSFLCELAARFPDKNFLGIERLGGRVEKASRRGPSRTGIKIDNIRVLQMETSYAVRYLLPSESVETFYLLFPDPWPKRRHHRRRIFSPEFLDSIHRALEPGGVLHIATDHLDYFQHMKHVALAIAQRTASELDRFNRSSFPIGSLQLDRFKRSGCSAFEVITGRDLELPPTKFEKRFREQGAPIYRLVLRKVSPVR